MGREPDGAVVGALLAEPGRPVAVVRTDAAALRSRPYPRMVPWKASSGSD